MKKALFSFILFWCYTILLAQDPVNWSYSAKKVGEKTYELHITARMDDHWHLYSQKMPDAGPLSTTIHYDKNQIVTLTGKTKEVGLLLEKYEEAFDVTVKYYTGKVDFVQLVQLKSNVKTAVTGTITFMACTEDQCLPPSTVRFLIKLE